MLFKGTDTLGPGRIDRTVEGTAGARTRSRPPTTRPTRCSCRAGQRSPPSSCSSRWPPLEVRSPAHRRRAAGDPRGGPHRDRHPRTALVRGVEALFEGPSIQDLISTPIGGALIGEFIFEPVRKRIKAKPELQWHDHVALVLTDPLGALNGVFERLLGIKSDVRVDMKPSQKSSREHGVSFKLTLAW